MKIIDYGHWVEIRNGNECRYFKGKVSPLKWGSLQQITYYDNATMYKHMSRLESGRYISRSFGCIPSSSITIANYLNYKITHHICDGKAILSKIIYADGQTEYIGENHDNIPREQYLVERSRFKEIIKGNKS